MGLHETRVAFWATYHETWLRGQIETVDGKPGHEYNDVDVC